MTNQIQKIPTLQELVKSENVEENNLMVLLNQNPPKEWIKIHPFIFNKDDKGKSIPYLYIPRERVEYVLSRIYVKWWLEIKSVSLIGNSVVSIVRLYVKNPINQEVEFQDGVGASPIQTDKNAGAIDFNQMKTGAIQIAAPSSETYAFKDAAEKLGKLFGKDLNVRDIDYNPLIKTTVDLQQLIELFEIKKDCLSPEDLQHAERIINEEESKSYSKLFNQLKSL